MPALQNPRATQDDGVNPPLLRQTKEEGKPKAGRCEAFSRMRGDCSKEGEAERRATSEETFDWAACGVESEGDCATGIFSDGDRAQPLRGGHCRTFGVVRKASGSRLHRTRDCRGRSTN